jgi:hypothetical protein
MRWRGRSWQFWLDTCTTYPVVVLEGCLLLLSTVLLLVSSFWPQWPYLVLALSYLIGTAALILVRETQNPSPQRRYNRLLSYVALGLGGIGLINLCQ